MEIKDISNRTKRMVEYMKSPIIKKRATIKCCYRCCTKSDLRKTDSGIYCWNHYVNGKECSEPGCHYPAVELGLCRFCLNRDVDEEDRKSLFFRSSLSRCQEI